MKAYHLYTSYPMILKAIMILKFVEFILPLPLSCWEIPFYPYCPNAPRWAPAAQWHYINTLVSNFTRANKKRRKVIPPFNEFFPEQLYLKNFQAASAFFRNFLSCLPPTGRVPSDTISTNQFQISRANKKNKDARQIWYLVLTSFFPDACLKRNLNETFSNGSTYIYVLCSNILVQ